jgi:hypothetical protein
MKLLHKVYRDKARLSYLLKDKISEKDYEYKASIIYEEYLEEKGIR